MAPLQQPPACRPSPAQRAQGRVRATAGERERARRGADPSDATAGGLDRRPRHRPPPPLPSKSRYTGTRRYVSAATVVEGTLAWSFNHTPSRRSFEKYSSYFLEPSVRVSPAPWRRVLDRLGVLERNRRDLERARCAEDPSEGVLEPASQGQRRRRRPCWGGRVGGDGRGNMWHKGCPGPPVHAPRRKGGTFLEGHAISPFLCQRTRVGGFRK